MEEFSESRQETFTKKDTPTGDVAQHQNQLPKFMNVYVMFNKPIKLIITRNTETALCHFIQPHFKFFTQVVMNNN